MSTLEEGSPSSVPAYRAFAYGTLTLHRRAFATRGSRPTIRQPSGSDASAVTQDCESAPSGAIGVRSLGLA